MILVIDDDKELQQTLEEMLRFEGYIVIGANDGEQGLSLLENNTVACIISDYQMPKLNGAELLAIIRSRPDTATLPFIMMSGVAAPELDLKFEFLRKPFHIEHLLELLQSIL